MMVHTLGIMKTGKEHKLKHNNYFFYHHPKTARTSSTTLRIMGSPALDAPFYGIFHNKWCLLLFAAAAAVQKIPIPP